jgi:signal transduction histidine kinase
MASACQHQESLRAEVRINRNDGQYGWVLVSVVPRYTATGLFMGFVGSGIDITDKKLLEESLEKAKVTAEDLNRRKSEFLSMMSHELRTPLNSIIGYSSIIQNNMAGPLNDNQSKFIQNVVYSGKHLLNLVNDLLDLSKVEAGKMKITVSQFDLPVLVQDVQSMLNDLAHRKNITLTFSIQPGITTVQADPERFKQILINLITNGIKFNRPGGEVRVRLFKRDDDAWLIGQVQDSGIGIPKSKFANLFGKFYQVDTSPARSNEGSGLGLALTKELIELHGGTIEVDSEEGVGTTFTFRLPTVQTVVVKGTHNDAVRNSSR